jgi:hypothetical protein
MTNPQVQAAQQARYGAPRRAWIPAGAGLSGVEDREVHAIEHIAHYLDRIDISLERIATSLENNNVSVALRTEMAQLRSVIQQKR